MPQKTGGKNLQLSGGKAGSKSYFRDLGEEETITVGFDGTTEIDGGVDAEAVAFIKAKKKFETLQRAKK